MRGQVRSLAGMGNTPALDPVVELGAPQAVNLGEATQNGVSLPVLAHPLLPLPGWHGSLLLESFQLHPRSLPHRRPLANDALRSPLTARRVDGQDELLVWVETADGVSKERAMRRQRMRTLLKRLNEPKAQANRGRDDLLVKLGQNKPKAGRA